MNELAVSPTLTVNVRELLRQPGAHKHVVRRGPVPDLATPVARVDPTSPVTVDAEIESVVEGLLVTGKVSVKATLECARCLRPIEQHLHVDVRELFVRDPREAEDDGYVVLPDDRLPLETMARDAIVLAFPAAPLCRDDCAGLCAECGADRNVTDCGHRPGTVDPRWSALAAPDLGALGEEQEQGHNGRGRGGEAD
jgi:uncharacterized protein